MSDQTSSGSSSRALPRGALVSIVCTVALALILVIVGTAALVRHAATGGSGLSPRQTQLINAVATLPGRTREAVRQVLADAKHEPRALLIDKAVAEKPYWERRFPAPEDTGYLLFSGVDPRYRQSIVQLIRINDGLVMAEWVPDWKAIFKRISDKPGYDRGNPANARAVHPLLLDDGSIVFNTSHSLVRIGRCSGAPVWVLDQIIHHSIELDNAGNLLVSGVSDHGLADNPTLQKTLRDDSIARVSVQGTLLQNLSFIEILRQNGLGSLLLGIHGALSADPVHINQLEEARDTTPFWEKGDLLISSRHLSTVFLYRLRTGKILWYRQGPWMNQHSASFHGDRYIAVFDNNIVNGLPEGFITAAEHNRVLLLDLSNGEISEPFKALLDRDRPSTITEGRVRLLPDGGMYIEDSDHGRHLRYTKDELLWSRVNDFDDGRIGNVAWSRYLTSAEASAGLAASAGSCTAAK